jgi:hypothetical protein
VIVAELESAFERPIAPKETIRSHLNDHPPDALGRVSQRIQSSEMTNVQVAEFYLRRRSQQVEQLVMRFRRTDHRRSALRWSARGGASQHWSPGIPFGSAGCGTSVMNLTTA